MSITVRTLRLSFVIAVGIVAGYAVSYILHETDEQDNRQQVQQHKEPLQVEDLQFVPWDFLDLYKPDTTIIDSTCVVAPREILSRESGADNFQPHYDIDHRLPNFALLPISSGSPAVQLSPYQTTIQTYDPRTGAGMEMTFDVPQNIWRWDIAGTAFASRTEQFLVLSAPLKHQRDRLTASLGPNAIASSQGVSFGLSAGFSYTVVH